MSNVNEKLISKAVKDQIIQKIRFWWDANHGRGPAVIGISGGKDSTVAAGLMCAAIGRENVLGVLLPDGKQKDIADSFRICRHLKINYVEVNIGDLTEEVNRLVNTIAATHVKEAKTGKFPNTIADFTRRTTNVPPRVRMTMLYAIAQSYGGRVIGTGNAAEAACGYFTWGGDCICDFNPLKNLFVDEVVTLGKMLKIPAAFLEKKPSDGLSGKTDEENLGFSYADVKKVVLKPDGWQYRTPGAGSSFNADCMIPFADIERRISENKFKANVFNVPGIDFYRDRYGDIVSVK